MIFNKLKNAISRAFSVITKIGTYVSRKKKFIKKDEQIESTLKEKFEELESKNKYRDIAEKYGVDIDITKTSKNLQIELEKRGFVILSLSSLKRLFSRKYFLKLLEKDDIDAIINKLEDKKIITKNNCNQVVRKYSELFVDELINEFSKGIQNIITGKSRSYSNVTRYPLNAYSSSDFKLFVASADSPFLKKGEAFILRHYKNSSVFRVSNRKLVFHNRYTGKATSMSALDLLKFYSKNTLSPNSIQKRRFFAISFKNYMLENPESKNQLGELKKKYLNYGGRKYFSYYKRKDIFESFLRKFVLKYGKRVDFLQCVRLEIDDTGYIVRFKPKI
ncbi:MAG: hypothetical protein KatS3mg068_1583 [Candidatus Sericytochromatia bacterium]|nr:MAG: hypothetical protein KatS3mg068_1583 [Candidatus Sericytochromatia bacterium]